MTALLACVLVGSCDLGRPVPAVEGAEVQRYRVRGRVTMRVRRRSGDDAVRFGWDLVAALQRVSEDSAHAWIDEGTAFIANRNRRVESEPDFLIRRPFVLVRDEEGHFRSVARPDVPDDLPQTARYQSSLVELFENFLPPVPEGALQPGATWTDAFSFVRGAEGDEPRPYTATTTYRVVGDTTAAGRAGVVLDVTSETVRVTAPEDDWQRGSGWRVLAADGTTLTGLSRVEGVLAGEEVRRLGMGADSVQLEATNSVELIGN